MEEGLGSPSEGAEHGPRTGPSPSPVAMPQQSPLSWLVWTLDRAFINDWFESCAISFCVTEDSCFGVGGWAISGNYQVSACVPLEIRGEAERETCSGHNEENPQILARFFVKFWQEWVFCLFSVSLIVCLLASGHRVKCKINTSFEFQTGKTTQNHDFTWSGAMGCLDFFLKFATSTLTSASPILNSRK